MDKAYKVLIADLIGLKFDSNGVPDHSSVKAYIEDQGHTFHVGLADGTSYSNGIHFFYQPSLSREDEILPITLNGQYDALIAAATFIPAESAFAEGGVRIGAGTGNMGAACWGGGNGEGGNAPLMNTPSFNSRATAQMALKALLKVLPDLDVATLHARTCAGDFDTGKNLAEFPTEKIEGKTIAVIGYGNIGREVANLAKAFGMEVRIYARSHHQAWIESEGFTYAPSIFEAATGADALSPHTGLGAFDGETGTFANAGLINAEVLNAMNDDAVIVNYDRGEVVDAQALNAALSSGKIRHAAVDADLFIAPGSGTLSGPMVPYLDLLEEHADKLELLPHAAADTEHVSRVEGAKQAVDQIVACITEKRVMNLKGALPKGYTDGGAITVPGVGKVTPNRITAAATGECAGNLAETARKLAELWQHIENASDDEKAATALTYAETLTNLSNHYITMVEKMGLKGPYYG